MQNKKSKISLMTTVMMLIVALIANAQTTNDYRSSSSGNWNERLNWERYNGTSWLTPTAGEGAPNSGKNVITIRNGHSMTVTANLSTDQTIIESGGEVIINSGVTFTTANGTGTDISIQGDLRNSGTVSLSSGATGEVNNGGFYRHTRNGGAIPAFTWNAGSTCEVTGITNTAITTSSLPQSYYNFVWNSPFQTVVVDIYPVGTYDISMAGDFIIESTGTGSLRFQTYWNCSFANKFGDVDGNFILKSGTLNFTNVGTCTNRGTTLRVKGDLIMEGGTISETNSGFGAIEFNGSGIQNFIKTGGTIQDNVDFIIVSGATVNFGDQILNNSDPASDFTINNGGTMIIGNSDGISISGNTGNIQVGGTRTYNTGANYTYNGLTAQITGSGLPAIVNNLTINNANEVTLSNNIEVDGSFTNTTGSIFNTSDRSIILFSSSNNNLGTINVNVAGSFETDDFGSLASSGIITVLSDINGHGSFVHADFTNSGTFNVQRYLSGGSHLPYRFITVPIVNASFTNIRKPGDYVPFWYDETVDNPDLDFGWTSVRSVTFHNLGIVIHNKLCKTF